MQDDGKLSLHNHLRFTILYHRDVETDLSRIVGFEVKPFSIQHKYDGTWNEDKADLSTCNPGSMKYVSDKDDPQEMKEGKEVIFTYDVVYEVSYKHLRCWHLLLSWPHGLFMLCSKAYHMPQVCLVNPRDSHVQDPLQESCCLNQHVFLLHPMPSLLLTLGQLHCSPARSGGRRGGIPIC